MTMPNTMPPGSHRRGSCAATQRRFRLVVAVAAWTVSGCRESAAGQVDASPAVGPTLDCVGVLHVKSLRGSGVANAQRFGQQNPALRTTKRLGDLQGADLAAFCDWEACITSNGYAHVCALNEGGLERCKVCDAGTDCAGRPMSRADCVAHATDVGRASCHAGLLQECLIQRALRGVADPRITETCAESDQACAGETLGDLTAEALAAQHETDQVTVQVYDEELGIAAQLAPDASNLAYWSSVLSAWDGGLPTDVNDGGADGPSD
jgi:histone H3/H4